MRPRRFLALVSIGHATLACDGGSKDSATDAASPPEASPGKDAGDVTPEGGAGDVDSAVPDGGTSASLLDAPLQPFPSEFSKVGLYTHPGDFETTDPRAYGYEPKHPLWSNGGEKQRFIVLPPGSTIDTGERWAWQFPVGSLLFKTFSFPLEPGGDAKAVETRVLRRGEEEWDYAVYIWNDDQTRAELSPMTQAVGAEVIAENGDELLHLVPSRRMCVRCHEAGTSFVLGFSELQLNFAPEASDNLLQRFEREQLFAQPLPDPPLEVSFDDALTERVVGYLQGNCVHCHNGQDTDLNGFDMRPDVALANLIDQPTSASASAAGIRIVPGSPEDSIAFQAFSGETDNPEVEFMPNVGVQLRDGDAVQTMREWIVQLGEAMD